MQTQLHVFVDAAFYAENCFAAEAADEKEEILLLQNVSTAQSWSKLNLTRKWFRILPIKMFSQQQPIIWIVHNPYTD